MPCSCDCLEEVAALTQIGRTKYSVLDGVFEGRADDPIAVYFPHNATESEVSSAIQTRQVASSPASLFFSPPSLYTSCYSSTEGRTVLGRSLLAQRFLCYLVRSTKCFSCANFAELTRWFWAGSILARVPR